MLTHHTCSVGVTASPCLLLCLVALPNAVDLDGLGRLRLAKVIIRRNYILFIY